MLSGGAPSGHVEMDGGAVLGVEPADPGRHLRSPIAALGAVACVAESTHQLDERVGDAALVPARRTRGFGEAVAGQRRRDHVERVRRVAPKGLRVGEPWDDIEELDDWSPASRG